MQRESLNTRQGSKAGKIRVRTGREKMRPPPLSAKKREAYRMLIEDIKYNLNIYCLSSILLQ